MRNVEASEAVRRFLIITTIGFIGLLTPNLARLLGARSARDELLYSTLLGALLLLSSAVAAMIWPDWQ